MIASSGPVRLQRAHRDRRKAADERLRFFDRTATAMLSGPRQAQ